MLISKPLHNKYAFCNFDNNTYNKTVKVYCKCKQYSFRSVVAFCTGTGTISVIKEIMKGTVVQYGKRRLALVVLISAAHICAPAITVLSNVTRVVKTCKVIYITTGYIIEACEDIGTIFYLPIDYALLGQPIPTGTSKRYSNWDEIENLIKDLPFVGVNVND